MMKPSEEQIGVAAPVDRIVRGEPSKETIAFIEDYRKTWLMANDLFLKSFAKPSRGHVIELSVVVDGRPVFINRTFQDDFQGGGDSFWGLLEDRKFLKPIIDRAKIQADWWMEVGNPLVDQQLQEPPSEMAHVDA